MRRSARTTLLLVLLAWCVGGACSTDGPTDGAAPSSTTTTSRGIDAQLDALALRADDLPPGFVPSRQVDDTITTFCATEDATAGLHATARVVRGFTKDGGGASVIQLAFRFPDGGAARFVAQAEAVLARCSGVPDVSGLAFDYDALAPELIASVEARTDSAAGRHGINVGSGKLSIDVVVLQQGEVGQLVAVLGVDLPRPALDSIALAALRAAVSRA